MAHLSEDAGLIDAFNAAKTSHHVAARVFGVSPADVDAEMRRRIKAMSYGLAYGLSSYGLAQQLGITPDEARVLMESTSRGSVGCATTWRSRRAGPQGRLHRDPARPPPVSADLVSDNRQRREMAERMALNAPIQGSAADIVKVAMLDVQGLSRLSAWAAGCSFRSTTNSCWRCPGELRPSRPSSCAPWRARPI